MNFFVTRAARRFLPALNKPPVHFTRRRRPKRRGSRDGRMGGADGQEMQIPGEDEWVGGIDPFIRGRFHPSIHLTL